MNNFERFGASQGIKKVELVIASAIENYLNKDSDFGIFTHDNKIDIDKVDDLIGLFEKYPDFEIISEKIENFLLIIVESGKEFFSEKEREGILFEFRKILKECLKIRDTEGEGKKEKELVLN